MSETKLELKMHDTTFCDHYILWPIVFAFISFIHHPVKSKLIKSSKLIGYTFDSDFGLNKKGTEETIRKCLQGHFVLLDRSALILAGTLIELFDVLKFIAIRFLPVMDLH